MASPRRSWIEASLQALGRDGFPETVELRDGTYRFARVLQHSFYAATACYLGPSGKMVIKWGRTTSFFGFPLAWLGRWLAGRELRIYQAVEDLAGVPECFGAVGTHGFAHIYVEGHPHYRSEPLGPDFFRKLLTLLDEIHSREMAYVDLSKQENILVGDDGLPYLIDFQTAFVWPSEWKQRRGLLRLLPDAIGRRILAGAQEADCVHVFKHWRRSAEETLPADLYARSVRQTGYIRFHLIATTPYRWLRRTIRKLWNRDRLPPDGPPAT